MENDGKVRLINVKDLNKYYELLNKAINISVLWNSLQSKCEYGTYKSEKGYQRIAKNMSGNIARILGANSDLVELLSMCYGSFFPEYGKTTIDILSEYLDIDKDFPKEYIEYQLNYEGSIISPEFDKYLDELFSDESDVLEVNIVKLCSKTIDYIRYDNSLINSITKIVENECLKENKVIDSKKLEELFGVLPQKKTVLPDNIKQLIRNDIDEFIEYYKNLNIGIYEFMGLNQKIDKKNFI